MAPLEDGPHVGHLGVEGPLADARPRLPDADGRRLPVRASGGGRTTRVGRRKRHQVVLARGEVDKLWNAVQADSLKLLSKNMRRASKEIANFY